MSRWLGVLCQFLLRFGSCQRFSGDHHFLGGGLRRFDGLGGPDVVTDQRKDEVKLAFSLALSMTRRVLTVAMQQIRLCISVVYTTSLKN